MPRKYEKKADKEARLAAEALARGETPPEMQTSPHAEGPVPAGKQAAGTIFNLPQSEISMAVDPGRNALVPSAAIWASLEKVAATVIASGFCPEKIAQMPKLLVVLLKAWELGIPLLTAVREIYVTDDQQLALQAATQRALIERSGLGYVQLIESTNEIARAEGVRYGLGGRSDRRTEVTYTIADLQSSGGQVKFPADSLAARATSRLARQMFSDVVQGLGFDPSELTGGAATPMATQPVHQKPPVQAAPPKNAEPVVPKVVTVDSPPPPTQETPTKALESPVQPVSTPTPAQTTPQAQNGAQNAPQAETAPKAPELPALTHAVQITKQDGTIGIQHTAGIELGTIQQITGLTSLPACYAEAKVVLDHWGFPGMRYCTEAQGQALLNRLRAVSEGKPVETAPIQTPPVQRTARVTTGQPEESIGVMLLKQVVEKLGLMDRYDTIVRMVLTQKQKGSLDEIDPTALGVIVKEIQSLGTDSPQGLMLAIERFAGNQ